MPVPSGLSTHSNCAELIVMKELNITVQTGKGFCLDPIPAKKKYT